MRSSSRRNSNRHLPDSIPISVIIPAGNEQRTIRRVIAEAKKISKNTEVIVVCNGVTDKTSHWAKKAGANVIEFEKSLGHDVGRAIGAQKSKGKVLLFIDADFVIPASVLRKYCLEVIKGWDVVLNTYSGAPSKKYISPTQVAKRLLNHLLDHSDLHGSSFTSVPHACSREAVEVIGYENLAVPPKAHSIAILRGLKINRSHCVLTSRVNKKRRKEMKQMTERLILGDHVEAINTIIQERGARGGFTDFLRNRAALFLAPANSFIEPLPAGGEQIDVETARQGTTE